MGLFQLVGFTFQLQYQQRIFKLEKENQEIRRQIMLRQEGRDIKSRKLKVRVLGESHSYNHLNICQSVFHLRPAKSNRDVFRNIR